MIEAEVRALAFDRDMWKNRALDAESAGNQVAEGAARLRAALEGVLKSFEAHIHLREPKPEDEMDEYDYAMRPLWEAARDALEGR